VIGEKSAKGKSRLSKVTWEGEKEQSEGELQLILRSDGGGGKRLNKCGGIYLYLFFSERKTRGKSIETNK